MSEEVTKKKIELEVEVGTTSVERGINPYQKWIYLARAVDAWRIFPRLFLTVYIFLLYYSTMWFMSLPDPSLEQSGLISIIVGAGAAWFGLYAGTSNSSKNFKGEE
jgi:MFS superfamily sulfate permease-like transporter